MACCLVEILGVADGRDGRVEVARHFVADVLGAVFIFFYALADGEVGMLEAVVGNGVGAEVLVGRTCRASLDPTAGGGRRHMRCGCFRSVARTIAVVACFGLLLVVPHVWRRLGRGVLMVSRERGEGLE